MPITAIMDSGKNNNNMINYLSKICAKVMVFVFAATGFMGAAITSAQAQETADAEITVVTPLSFISTDDLNFGDIIPSNQAGQVRMTADGNRTATNGIILVGGNQQAGGFAGQGAFFQIVEISLGANTTQITGPGAPMTVRNFTILSTVANNGVILNTNPRRFRITSPTGIFIFGIGATLDVGANQTPGRYSGTWDITLNYQ